MSINISRYVDITSGVGGVGPVPVRQLGGLIISNNNLIPTGVVLNFTSAEDVGGYFGTAGEEYARAEFYFGWISKNISQPQNLSFWFWNNDSATTDLIFGAPPISTLTEFQAITTGDFTLTMGGYTHHLTGVDLSGAGTLAAVATDLTNAIQAISAGGAPWASAVVTYDSTSGAFNLVSGEAEADTITIAAGVTEDMAGPLGWLSPNTILSNGTAAQLLPDNLTQLNALNNNFGSFCFCSTFSTEANILAAATWNYALTPNWQYLFSWVVSTANAAAWKAQVAGIGGQCGWIASPQASAYPEMEPMMIFDATDYNGINSVQNYMFQVFNDTASVTTDAAANTYDALKLNYYGQTQEAGVNLSFTQRGVISGGQITDATDIGYYANEIWLKASITAAFMNLLLSLNQVPANNVGLSYAQTTIQASIQQALLNGTISVGKPLNTTQKVYITNATGNNTAWQQVQNVGYWLGVELESYIVDDITEWKIVYTLIYSKDDVIRLVDGTDILI